MKVIDFVKMNEIEIKNELIKLNLIDEEDDIDFVENIDDDKICILSDFGIDLSFDEEKVKDFDVENFKLKIKDKVLFGCCYSF